MEPDLLAFDDLELTEDFGHLVQRFADLSRVGDARRERECESLVASVRDFIEDCEAPDRQPSDEAEIVRVRKQLDDLLRLVMRAACHVPFDDVHSCFQAFAHELSERYDVRKYYPTPSRFLHPSSLESLDFDDGDVKSALQEEFSGSGIVRNIILTLGVQPRFLVVFLRTYRFLMRAEGPIPIPTRHYLAILASARHQCEYLVRWQVSEFLALGGNREWVEDPTRMDEKLKLLEHIHQNLAHRPWLLSPSLLESVCSEETSGPLVWSVSELIHAVAILSTFHQLASAVLGLGVVPEDQVVEFPSDDDEESIPFEAVPRPRRISRMRLSDQVILRELELVSPTPVVDDDDEDLGEGNMALEGLPSGLVSQAEAASQEEFFNALEELAFTNGTSHVPLWDDRDGSELYRRFLEDRPVHYRDFNCHKDPIAYVAQYNFDDDCFPLLSTYFEESADLLQREFNLIHQLTDNTLYGRQVNTKKLRRAMWAYIYRIFGIMMDDYDYSHINRVLNRRLKTYMKFAACYPEKIRKKHYDDIGITLTHREKAHLNMLVTSARKEVALIYACRAISQFLRGEEL